VDAEVGLRDLRQNASDVVRRVEAGESVVVTVSGRPAARLVPIGGRRWRRWDEVAAVLGGPGAPDLAHDLAAADDALLDPFEAQHQ
jgi:prevent-host-death family protein